MEVRKCEGVTYTYRLTTCQCRPSHGTSRCLRPARLCTSRHRHRHQHQCLWPRHGSVRTEGAVPAWMKPSKMLTRQIAGAENGLLICQRHLSTFDKLVSLTERCPPSASSGERVSVGREGWGCDCSHLKNVLELVFL